MISPQQINYILTLVETGNFSRAAEQCFVTQPTLSMQLKKAEDELKHKIFERSAQKMELTTFGEQLLPILRQIQQEYDSVQLLADESSGIHKHVLKIGMIPTITAYMLEKSFGVWKEQLPQTRLEIEELTTTEILHAIETRKIDIGILAGPVELNDVRTIPLFTEEILAFSSMGNTVVELQDLAAMKPWLLSKGNCLRTQMINFCGLSESTADEWHYDGSNLDLLTRMVRTYGGYTLIPEGAKSIFPGQLASIRDELGRSPARVIIGIARERNPQWARIEKIIRQVQLEYGQPLKNNLEILSWN